MLKKRYVVLAAVIAVVAAFLYFDLGQYIELARLQAWVDQNPVLAAFAFAGVYLTVASLSLPGVGPLSLAAGVIFGVGWGTLIVSFASSIGATLGMLISRTILRDWVIKHFAKAFAKVDAGVKRDGVFYLATLRLIPPIPFFIINLVFGLTAMRASTFYIVSQVAMLPATLLYVNAGASLGRVDNISFFEIFTPEIVASFAALIAFPFVVKFFLKRSRFSNGAVDVE